MQRAGYGGPVQTAGYGKLVRTAGYGGPAKGTGTEECLTVDEAKRASPARRGEDVAPRVALAKPRARRADRAGCGTDRASGVGVSCGEPDSSRR
ncbi:hypothetical protein FRAAL4061 [Frankia alni ACN14a]|uniref:Uncharacterized protein n=1 Tax=Frankia alni (strain DSM 45986 / CECT 9034 / ACN14a) TaxID=326424 RepID=Q0RIG6_FRAAA|nr:hypothetical protein FRAAL4061 [Frankia alni ACN14a]